MQPYKTLFQTISTDSVDFGLNIILNKFPKPNSYDHRNHHGMSKKRQTCNKFSEVLILSKKIKQRRIFAKRKGTQMIATFKLEAGSNGL